MRRLKRQRSTRKIETPLALLGEEGLRGAIADSDIQEVAGFLPI
jgi:hypothetical protein